MMSFLCLCRCMASKNINPRWLMLVGALPSKTQGFSHICFTYTPPDHVYQICLVGKNVQPVLTEAEYRVQVRAVKPCQKLHCDPAYKVKEYVCLRRTCITVDHNRSGDGISLPCSERLVLPNSRDQVSEPFS